mmetsp:Transcript_4384/g.12101  ORF Transcript_4384/g.12101 Transcript_4384/m.12101 type:complete len:108 (+) Transcript_4384:500-823(+)
MRIAMSKIRLFCPLSLQRKCWEHDQLDPKALRSNFESCLDFLDHRGLNTSRQKNRRAQSPSSRDSSLHSHVVKAAQQLRRVSPTRLLGESLQHNLLATTSSFGARSR